MYTFLSILLVALVAVIGVAVALYCIYKKDPEDKLYDSIHLDDFRLIKVSLKAATEAGDEFLKKYLYVKGAAHFGIMIQADDDPEDIAMKWAARIAPEHDLVGSIYENPGGDWVVDEALGMYTEPQDRTFYYNDHFHRRHKRRHGYFVCIA